MPTIPDELVLEVSLLFHSGARREVKVLCPTDIEHPPTAEQLRLLGATGLRTDEGACCWEPSAVDFLSVRLDEATFDRPKDEIPSDVKGMPLEPKKVPCSLCGALLWAEPQRIGHKVIWAGSCPHCSSTYQEEINEAGLR